MADIRVVTPTFAVAPQIEAHDIAAITEHGYRLIINNRPDGETPGQPSAADVSAVAAQAGLAYNHIPVVGRPTPTQVAAMRNVILEADGPVLAYCRSGTRSITAWALGEVELGGADRDAVLEAALNAGYDLSSVL